jgi:hypothetical protein
MYSEFYVDGLREKRKNIEGWIIVYDQFIMYTFYLPLILKHRIKLQFNFLQNKMVRTHKDIVAFYILSLQSLFFFLDNFKAVMSCCDKLGAWKNAL